MVSTASPSRRVGIALLVIALFLVGVTQPSVNDLPGFSDHTGPTEMRITEFDRLESGCAANVSSYRSGSWNGNDYSKVAFVRTDDPNANLSAWIERTSPAGVDLSTFRVHVESHSDAARNDSCETGVLYGLSVNTSGGSPAGILADAHGHRILWMHNGEYAGCSASYTSPLDAECSRFRELPQRTWANATDEVDR